MRDIQTLTRRQVARQEIETAIGLVFGGGSLVCANLLAWAAVDVLRGVAHARKVETYFDRLETMVRPEKLVEFRRLIRDHYTFAKHADRDPERVVENFNGETVNLVLLGATEDYPTLYGQQTLPMMLFKTWFLKGNLNLLTAEGQKMISRAVNALQIGTLAEAQALLAVAQEEGPSLVTSLPSGLRQSIEL
jgi:hypothetical protein